MHLYPDRLFAVSNCNLIMFVGVRINIIMYPVLMGVIRMSTFPLLVGEVESFEDHMDTLFKVVHVGPVATGIQVGGSCGWRFKAEPVISHSLLRTVNQPPPHLFHLVVCSFVSVPSICFVCLSSLHPLSTLFLYICTFFHLQYLNSH